MARRKNRDHLTAEEWQALPVTFEVEDAARAFAVSKRWANDHAAELGGRKIAGRWQFSKAKVAEMLGIEA